MKRFLAEFLAAICAALVLNYYFNDKPAEPPPQKVVIQVEQKTVVPEKPAVPVEQQPVAQDEPKNYFANGQFKVGVDLPAGEYKIALDAGGYFALTRDTRHAYVKNQYTNEGGQFYITVADGQYLQIKNGTGEFVGAAQ